MRSLIDVYRVPGENMTDEVSVRRGSPSADEIPDPVLVIDADGLLRFANVATDTVLGWNTEELIGSPVLDLVHPDDVNIAIASIATAASKPIGDVITVRIRTRDGGWRQLELRGWRVDVDGSPQTTVVARDTSDRHRFGLDQGDDELLRAVVSNMNSMVAVIDRDGTVRSFNEAVTRLLGHDPDVVRGNGLGSIIHPDDRDNVFNTTAGLAPMGSAQLDARLRDLGGDWATCDFTVKNLCDDPAVHGYLISGEVATSLSDARRRADFLTEHDTRTGLFNRDGFLRAASAVLRQDAGFGIMILDIARFRSINELYGESVGDSVLTSVADRLGDIRWPDLIIARFGGDEFVLAVPSPDGAALAALRERVVGDLVPPIRLDGMEISLAVRTAVAYDAQPDGLEPLLAAASNELMRAKRQADGDLVSPVIDSIGERRAHLDELRTALANGEIQPFYQPIVDPDGHVVAVEALVRWVHPERGVLGVGAFLPLARMAGMAEAIDDHVLDCALEFSTRLVASGHADVEVHVNVDPKVLGREAFADGFLGRCARHGADPRQMVIEITETDLLAPGAAALENLAELRRAGTCVTIDDFGTGFSSLSHLLELPVDGVKIDRTFVSGIDVDVAATNLTRAILGLSDSLDLRCVAEGVEEVYQQERLTSLGCTAFQGWLYSPAVHPDTVLELLPRISPSIPAT